MHDNLQSRLEAAREARRRDRQPDLPVLDPTTASRDRRVDGGPPPAPRDAAAAGDDGAPSTVIDLRTLRSVREAARRARSTRRGPAGERVPAWDSSPRASMTVLLQRQAALRGEAVTTTAPAQQRCPTCGGSVRLDLFDLVESVAHLTCLDCGFLYTARSPRG